MKPKTRVRAGAGKTGKRNPAPALRQLSGTRLCETYETQLQHLRAVHADQHPGNYLFQPDGRFGLVDFGSVKHLNFDIVELRQLQKERGWRKSEAAERRFLSIMYGKNMPHARARKILPLMEEWLDTFRPRGSTADTVIDFRNYKKANPKTAEIRRRITQQTLQDRLINPDFVYLMRADIGFWHLLGEIGAIVNVDAIFRRVAATPPATR
ncbi:MAG TPA: AarF/UbiB family protein [Verrucomicrobiae bacterium]|jgi:hypothetical protein